jgi:hypothetical protein
MNDSLFSYFTMTLSWKASSHVAVRHSGLSVDADTVRLHHDSFYVAAEFAIANKAGHKVSLGKSDD